MSHDFLVELPRIMSSLRSTSGKEENEPRVASVSSFGHSGTMQWFVRCPECE